MAVRVAAGRIGAPSLLSCWGNLSRPSPVRRGGEGMDNWQQLALELEPDAKERPPSSPSSWYS